ncbi:hypothetical protein [Amycolatopsis azurea]|uniref:Uncharacterized protein n=1 Tax=Amycolatopsis azurea DSM 43854 TaxID=1238180 RepID=M2QRH7_9PSEU|nr:hypothetical protein [Amycolatopsis azurea]EMD29261.1 hypothetical protein C791_5001 [Amycolatopsis azurea DSM 43854]OOC01901.1 hypothetical protein B0293_37000 [Amycolatopsis azurea DSM 43854]
MLATDALDRTRLSVEHLRRTVTPPLSRTALNPAISTADLYLVTGNLVNVLEAIATGVTTINNELMARWRQNLLSAEGSSSDSVDNEVYAVNHWSAVASGAAHDLRHVLADMQFLLSGLADR